MRVHQRITSALVFGLPLLLAGFHAPATAKAQVKCVEQYSTPELCVYPNVDMSRVHESPEVLLAAKVVALKMKPYFPENDPRMYLVMGYRSPAEQDRIRRTGVRAGPSSGRFVSAHIYGVALDVEIHSNRQLGHEMCAALNQILPLLKNKGGVIMEGTGGGSTNGHIDDNWGARFAMEKTGKQQSLNYTGPECPATYGVIGPSAEKFADMARITANSLDEKDREFKAATEENGDGNKLAPEGDENQEASAKKAPANRKLSSWEKYH
jgi:hypothetical protein